MSVGAVPIERLLRRGALLGDVHPDVPVRVITVEQMRDGYACGPLPVERHPYYVMGALPDGNVLVREPSEEDR